MIGKNEDDKLNLPLIELPSEHHHDFHLLGFHKPGQTIFFPIFGNLINIFIFLAILPSFCKPDLSYLCNIGPHLSGHGCIYNYRVSLKKGNIVIFV